MSEIRSGVRITNGPDVAQTAALKPRDRASFTFQFVEGGPVQPVDVTIVTIRHIADGVYMIICVVSAETHQLSYNAHQQIGVVVKKR